MTSTVQCACGCGQLVTRRGRSGPMPMYATPTCRVRAHRQRRMTAELVPLPDIVRDAPVRIAGRSPEEQVERAVLETRAVSFALQRLGTTTRPDLAWRCRRLGEAIQTALEDTFGGSTT